MNRHRNPLKHVKVASPCTADWERMIGDERRRFCGQCELNVYNLSDMTEREAADLINRTEGRLCVRFYRRADGTVLTKDCPVGLRAIRRRISHVRKAIVSSALSFFAGLGAFAASTYEFGEKQVVGAMAPVQQAPASAEPPDFPMMGDIASESALQGQPAYIPKQRLKQGKRSSR